MEKKIDLRNKHEEYLVMSLATISQATNHLYSRLTESLRKNTQSENGWVALLDMEYNKYLEVKDLDEFETEWGTESIHPKNYENETMNCMCGKCNIKRITIMDYNRSPHYKHICLGSECIETTLKFLKDIENVDNIRDKLISWKDRIEVERKKYSHKKCVGCDEYKIRKGYKYKNKIRNDWCKDCIIGPKVKCSNCPRYRFYQISKITNKPMKLCRSCYFNQI